MFSVFLLFICLLLLIAHFRDIKKSHKPNG